MAELVPRLEGKTVFLPLTKYTPRVKRLIPPVAICVFVLLVVELKDVRKLLFHLTNNFCVEGYQATSDFKASDEIVIVNISDFSAEEINSQVYILSKYNPSVTAMDYMVTDTAYTFQKNGV